MYDNAKTGEVVGMRSGMGHGQDTAIGARQSQIEGSMEMLERTIAVNQELINSLAEILIPITNQEARPEPGVAKQSQPEPVYVPLAQRIRQSVELLTLQSGRLRDLSQRLEL